MPVANNFFQKIPFIRITCLFLTGLLFSHSLSLNPEWIGLILTILILILIFGWHSSKYSTVEIQNLLLSACIVLIGIFYPGTEERQLPAFDRKDYFLAEVCQKPAEKAKTFQTILLIRNNALVNPEKVSAYFSKENFDSTISTGDQLVILAKPQQIKNVGNPYEIDYQKIMQQRGIWFSVFLSEGTYLKTGYRSHRLIYLAEQTRDNLISILTTALTEREERSVVSALTLGYRSEIEQDTLDYFASTGAMHVLSVSGLHVAMIYFILGFLLSFLKRGKTGTRIFYVVMILFLWIYAFITGFSPAVQRATVMFTFIVIGESIRRPVNIYNSLTASALFLILLSPNVIFDIGFQLSYLAVLGIVLIQPTLNNLLEITNPILKWCWSMFTVSVAAQLTTFPLGVFYFNQFPNFFWLSGFVVIPVTTLIIWLTLAFFVFSPFHTLALIIGWVIQNFTHLMLYLLKGMDAMPLAVSKGIVWTPAQVIVLFALLTAVFVFVYSKNKDWLVACLLFVILFQVIELQEKRQLLDQKIVIVYNTKNMMVHLINNRNSYLITNDYKNLSEPEIRALERVCYHLKLDKTKVISSDLSKSVHLNDLVIKDNQVQFSNSLINFNSSNKYSKNPDHLALMILPKKQNSKPVEKIVCLGNIVQKKQFGTDLFKLKQQGAFYANLNSE